MAEIIRDLPPTFGEYADMVVLREVFQRDLSLTDEEAQDHPDTLGSFYAAAKLVEEHPEITEAHAAVLDITRRDHIDGIRAVRTLNTAITAARRDNGLIDAGAYRGQLNNLASTAGINAAAETFRDAFGLERPVFQDQMLEDFLFGEPTEPNQQIIDSLTPNNFRTLLTSTVGRYCDADSAVLGAIERFARHAQVTYTDEPAIDLRGIAHRVDLEISDFLDSGKHINPKILALLTPVDLEQLRQLYDVNNLLAFANELVTPGSLSEGELDRVQRYNTVLRQLDAHEAEIARALADADADPAPQGYSHAAGVIDPSEYRTFDEVDTDDGHTVVTVERQQVYVKGGIGSTILGGEQH